MGVNSDQRLSFSYPRLIVLGFGQRLTAAKNHELLIGNPVMCEDAMWQLFRWGIRFISRAVGGAMSGGIWGEGGYVRERGIMEKTRREVICEAQRSNK